MKRDDNVVCIYPCSLQVIFNRLSKLPEGEKERGIRDMCDTEGTRGYEVQVQAS